MKSTEQFIRQANEKHNFKYDYSETVYNGSKKKVKIICHERFEDGTEHGLFEQEANSHLKGCGCPHCNGTTKLTLDDIIKKNEKVHGGKYSFERTVYVNNHTDFIVTCPIHGDFKIKPNNFFNGGGCQECAKVKRRTTEEVREILKNIYGNKYDFSESEFINARTPIKAICPIHGEFEKHIDDLMRGRACQECSRISKMKTIEEFIQDARKIHGEKYIYTEYKGNKTKVPIICPEHGEFMMTPNCHLNGQGCPSCGYEKNASKKRIGKEKTIERFKKKFGDLYDYSLWTTEYKNVEEEIEIICKKHGVFKKSIHDHFNGEGCPICRMSKLENSIRMLLIENGISFVRQKTYQWLKWKKKGVLKLDFYLPDYNIAIECQGGQHYAPFDIFGGEEDFKNTVERDKIKKELCEEHGIPILYFSTKKYVDDIITSKKQLLKEIKKYG